MKIALAALLALTPVSAVASPVYVDSEGYERIRPDNDSQAGYSNQRSCFKTEYREEYIPGTEDNPGYVKSWKDTVEVPCEDVNPDVGWHRPHRPHRPYYRRPVSYTHLTLPTKA